MRSRCQFLGLLLACLLAGSPALAELKPEQVAVIGSVKGRESNELAQHYLQARGIPKENLLLIDVPTSELLSRATWDGKIRPAIRKWLFEGDRSTRIRCLVTLWDVPLKIGGLEAGTGRFSEVAAALKAAEADCRAKTAKLAQTFNLLLNSDAEPLPDFPADLKLEDLSRRLDVPFQKAVARLQELARAEPNSLRLRIAQSRIEQGFQAGTGLFGSIRVFESQVKAVPKPNDEQRLTLETRRGELNGLRSSVSHLSVLPESVERDAEIIATLQQSDGLLGAVNWCGQQAELWGRNETHASFDSELALVLWPDHARLRWLPNLLHHTNGKMPNTRPPTLMVARLDGPTLETARRLIDDAVEIEKAGLTGRVYIDGRGLPPSREPGSYGEYDQSLRELASLLKNKTKLELVFDDKPELFGEDDCPDAALYCGWYSLANYVDAFKWQRGAVAYHIASGEATTLRTPKSNVWCKRMLEEGVAGTLGPTYEPYLAAFPRPSEFFPLLLTGKMTLVEVYAATNPFQSWVMTLVGDPLYNPYRNSPQIAVEDLPPVLQAILIDP